MTTVAAVPAARVVAPDRPDVVETLVGVKTPGLVGRMNALVVVIALYFVGVRTRAR